MDYEIAFKEGLPYDCTCPVCDQALRAPIITNCGHNFCKQCINTDNGPVSCPVCKAEIAPGLIKPDKNKHRQVQALLVKCPYVHGGCTWVGPLKEMQKHAESCEYHGVPCTNECGKIIPEKEMAAHLVECQKKRTKCTYCNMLIKTPSMEKHLKICPRMIISCPFQCGLNDRPREEIEKHRATCPNVDNACPFAELGCDYIGDKTTVQKHLAEEPIKHLMLLCDEVTELKNYHILAQAENVFIDTRYEELMRRTKTAAQMYGAQLVWRIDNVAQKMNDAKSGTRPTIHSEPFVSGRHGYKFVASACLFGDGQYRGKYLAVYVTLVRGKYDPLLDWPFDHVVCITLLDQNPEAGKRCDISYWVDPKKIKEKTEFLQKPLTDKNGSFGAQTFCRLEVMENYIKDDTMFLQVEIKVVNEPEELPAIALMNGQPPPRGAKPPATPDTHSVMDLSAVARTPRGDEGRLPTAMKVPESRGSRPPSAQVILESRPSLAQLPPQPIMPDGLQPVNATSARIHTPKSGRNVVAPMPQSAPIVVSEKSEIPEVENVERPRSKA
ncbi:hypothetical protein Aduo_009707 [Ancylostoma duodenale]